MLDPPSAHRSSRSALDIRPHRRPAAIEPSLAPRAQLGLKHVYLIDKDDSTRVRLASSLSKRSSFAVRAFPSGEAFLATARDVPLGVVLIGCAMFGAEDPNILHHIRSLAEARFAPIIMASGGNIPLAVQAIKAGALDFIEKPCPIATLLSIVDDAFCEIIEDNAAAAHVRDAQDRIAALSPREYAVLSDLIEGHSNKVIAHHLTISPRTVEIYRANLMVKLHVRNLSEMLRVAFTAGIVPT
ncbi:response regulator transcription factor [Sphingomonas qilianensis]|uniref:LuxR C-terminal-related transcriptional regulator n=1 Tax=Sphingomonas qilianensis TaxID=1736690 RepID=A0ABU9XWL2_9SPHN